MEKGMTDVLDAKKEEYLGVDYECHCIYVRDYGVIKGL